jgi:DNA mismatch endonuclease (patch repair protein)
MMAGISGKNTKPELQLRSLLHRRGFRFRLHRKDLPGRPDIVFPGYRAVIFINGCFWHGHDCHFFRLPKTRSDFWLEKIQGNRARDIRQLDELRLMGWRTLVIWECATRKGALMSVDALIDRVEHWLKFESDSIQIDAKGVHDKRQNK